MSYQPPLPISITLIFLLRYYDRENDDTPLETIIALLSLSGKYDVATVRTDVVKQLSRHYPTSLSQYDALSSSVNAKLFGTRREDCHFALLRACDISQADIRIILPALFYACSNALIFSDIIEEEAPLLPFPTLQALLIGERALANQIRYKMSGLLDKTSPPSGCPYNASVDVCSTARRSPETSEMVRVSFLTEFSEIRSADIAHVYFEKRCERCRRNINDSLNILLNEMWDRLPEFFRLESWDAVRGEN